MRLFSRRGPAAAVQESPERLAHERLRIVEGKLADADAALLRFRQEHCRVLDGCIVIVASDVAARERLDKEYEQLLQAHNEAHREFQCALADWATWH